MNCKIEIDDNHKLFHNTKFGFKTFKFWGFMDLLEI